MFPLCKDCRQYKNSRNKNHNKLENCRFRSYYQKSMDVWIFLFVLNKLLNKLKKEISPHLSFINFSPIYGKILEV